MFFKWQNVSIIYSYGGVHSYKVTTPIFLKTPLQKYYLEFTEIRNWKFLINGLKTDIIGNILIKWQHMKIGNLLLLLVRT